MIRLWTAGAILAALCLVLLGRVIPFPPLVTGEEGSRTTLVAIRQDTVRARSAFLQAQLDYQRFLTAPLGNLPDEMRKEADEMDAGGDRATLLAMARDRGHRMIALGQAMLPYAMAGDQFFATLQTYDDDLMSWSRTLGPRSEELRRATWPLLEWLKKYPQPIGLDTEFAIVPASSDSPMAKLIAQLPAPAPGAAVPPAPPPPVSTTLSLLDRLVPQLDAPNADATTLRRVALVGDGLWAAGKNIPSVDRYHDGYFSALRRYDADSVAVAVTPDRSQPSGQTIRAWAGAVALGAVLMGALLLLFAPPAFWRRVPLVARGNR